MCQARVAADQDRVLRHLQHPGGRSSGRWLVFEDAKSRRRSHYRKFTIRETSNGQATFGVVRELISRRFSLDSTPSHGAVNIESAVTPNLVVHRRRQGAAERRARRDAGELDLPRRRRVALAKRARGGVQYPVAPPEVRPLAGRSPLGDLLQRIRDEAHRFAITFHRQTPRQRPPGNRCSHPAGGRRPGAKARAPAALWLGRADPGRGLAGGTRGRSGRARNEARRDLRAAAQSRTRLSVSSCRAAVLLRLS